MSHNSMQPAFIEAEDRHLLLCDPPRGSFDKDSPALNWVVRGYSSTQYHSVYILTDRYPDFLAGENARAGGCEMYLKKLEKVKIKQAEDQVSVLRCPMLTILNELSCKWHLQPLALRQQILLLRLAWLQNSGCPCNRLMRQLQSPHHQKFCRERQQH